METCQSLRLLPLCELYAVQHVLNMSPTVPLPQGGASAPQFASWCVLALTTSLVLTTWTSTSHPSLLWTSLAIDSFALVAEPKPVKGEGSSCALRFLEPRALDKSFGDFPLRTWPRSCFLSSLLDTLLGGARRRSLSHRMPPPKQQKGGGGGASSSMASKSEETGYADLRDSYVPLFSGQPADYKEWRQRIQLYHRKMSLSKRSQESVLNIVGSFKGVVWRLFEDWGLDKLEKDNAFEEMLKLLDGNFAYDQRVQLPSDFEGYFTGLQRLPGQTLLNYVNDHEEAYRKLLAHKVSLPEAVQGWHLLRRASLTREQRQLLMLKAPTLEKAAVIEALYLILGQDYKGGGWNHDRNRRFSEWTGKAYAAQDDWEEMGEEPAWEETGYYEEDYPIGDYDPEEGDFDDEG